MDCLKLALVRELDFNHGRKGEVDRLMGHYEGFLRRKIGDGFKLTIGELVGALEAMAIDPDEFFARALDILTRSGQLLRRQEKPEPAGRPLAAIEAAALALEADPPPVASPPAASPARSREQLESLVRTGMNHQRGILRKAAWARDPAALSCYLELLDGLRFVRARDAAALARTVAAEVVAGVSCAQKERLELLCHAIGAFASAQRITREFATAARAVGFGLRLADRHGLVAARAGLLQRGAYVLRDAGRYDHALVLLDEAVALWGELGRPADFGKALIDRAIIFGHQDKVSRADGVFKVGLSYLSGNTESHRIFRLAAAHGIAFTQLRMGNADEAERWLRRALDLVGDDEPAALGKLIRQKGEICYQRGDYRRAERAFADARRILEVSENAVQGALVALDLAAALHAQDKCRQLRRLAEDMTGLLRLFEDDRTAQAALMRFIRAGLEGRVSEDLIADAGKKLGRARPLAGAPGGGRVLVG